MNNLFNRLVYICVVLLMVSPLVSCGGGGGSPAGTGTLNLGLTDASTDKYQAIYVIIAEVQVKKQGEGDGEAGWETVVMPEQTYNLLDLVNGVIATLGVGELEAGQYGQMRLILGELPETLETNILGHDHPYANYLIDLASCLGLDSQTINQLNEQFSHACNCRLFFTVYNPSPFCSIHTPAHAGRAL
jgi:hypothetical protein